MKHQRERIESVDVLRGLFAVSIMVYHCLFWSFEDRFANPVGAWRIADWLGIYGVEAFFIISAISLTHVYGVDRLRTKNSVKDYFWKRLVRLWPLYTMATLVATAFRFMKHEAPIPLDLALNLTLLFGFVDPAKSAVIGGWSIGVEVVMYALFPILVWLSRLWKPAIAILALGSFAAMMLWQTKIVGNIMDPFLGSIYVHPINHLFFFVSGCVVYGLWESKPDFSRFWSLAFFVVAVAAILFFSTGQTEIVTGWRRVLFAFLIVAFCWSVKPLKFSRSEPTGKRNLLVKGLIHLGAISYSVYLLHPFVYQGLKLLGAAPPQVAYGTMLFTPLVATAVYYGLERPTIQWGKAFSVSRGWVESEPAQA